MRFSEARRLVTVSVADLPIERLPSHKAKLVSAFYSARGDYGEAQQFRDGYIVPIASESASGFTPKDKFLFSNICFQMGECDKRLGVLKNG